MIYYAFWLIFLVITFNMQSVPVKVVVGSHVWAEDPEIAWIDGEVVEVNGEELKITCISGKTVSVASQEFFQIVGCHYLWIKWLLF